MSKGIPLSEKHGLNPCMPICFWCGEETGEIALLGKLPGDVEAPHRAVLNYMPCAKCAENWSKGVTIFETSTRPQYEGQPKLSGYYPTGKYLVMSKEAGKRLFDSDVERIAVNERTFAQIIHMSEGGK